MHFRHILGMTALAVIGAIALAQAQTAPRQTAGSHITVNTCNPHRHHAGVTHPWIDPYGIWHPATGFPYSEGFLEIAYTNDAKSAAKEIDFGLVSRGTMIAVATDVGTFSPGAVIDHEFVVSPEIFPIGTSLPYCAVLRVKYADGTEWRNPHPPQEG